MKQYEFLFNNNKDFLYILFSSWDISLCLVKLKTTAFAACFLVTTPNQTLPNQTLPANRTMRSQTCGRSQR